MARRISWTAAAAWAAMPRSISRSAACASPIGYCHIEKLHNLEALPPNGFTVACFPVKVKGGSAGWTRAVAILDN
jgi:hypothetical protein